jgi:hypothetical protein
MSYKVLKRISLDGINTTGKTKHYFGNEELPKPVELQIVQYDGDTGYYLFYLNKDGEEMTDTYHDTIEAAFRQAEWEFNIKQDEWVTIKD